jgi:hypothetical protein
MKTLQILFLSVICFTAIAVGFVFLVQPVYPFGLSPSNLIGTPFENYFLPGLLLIVMVGGSSLVAIIHHLQEHEGSFAWTIFSGSISLVWIVIQIAIWKENLLVQWGYVALCAMLILISLQVKHKELI